jgi:hypothetical protein
LLAESWRIGRFIIRATTLLSSAVTLRDMLE